jgi:hypothetical protein
MNCTNLRIPSPSRPTFACFSSNTVALAAAIAIWIQSTFAVAQAAPEPAPLAPETPPLAAPADTPAPMVGAPEAMPPAAPPPSGIPETPIPGAPTEAATTPAPMPTAAELKAPSLHVAAWIRVGGRLQGSKDPKKLNDQSFDTVYGEVHLDGTVFDHVSVTLNLNANGLEGKAGIEDAILGFDFIPEAHLWLGQMLVPADRANYSGPFFMIPWNYPGILSAGSSTVTILPKEGLTGGRNTGATLWGDIGGGKLKYLLGVFDFSDVTQGLLFSGRLNFDIIGKEPGFFGNASYFGEQDVLAVGLSGQYQRQGSVGAAPMVPAGMTAAAAPKDNYGEVSADLLAEFKLGDSGGWFTAEGAYYHFEGDYQAVKNGFFALLAIATPKVGIGNIQPMVRLQYGKGDVGLKVSQIDASVAYLIKGPGLRVTLNYLHTDLGMSRVANALQIGTQGIFF